MVIAPEASQSTAPHPPPAKTAHSTRFDRLALIIPAVVAAGVTLWWFPFTRFMAAGDITPFIRDGTAGELFSFWNHRSTGTGGTSAPVARLFEVVLIKIVGLAGGSEMVAQHLQYALVLGFAGFAVAYLTRALVRDPVVVGVAGLLGVFNPFVLVHLPNLLPVLWIGLVAALSGMVLRAARGVPMPPLLFAGTSLAASYLSVNPPLLATAVVTVVAVTASSSLLVGPGGCRRATRFVGSALPWVVVLNLWWLVPTVVSTVQREGVALSAQTRVQDWSWSHAQNSLTNIISLKADWGWRYPEYSPYARGLDTPPWAWLRWILPILALAAPFVTKGRQQKAVFTLLGAGAAVIVVAKGLHWPFESINLWLYEHVPGAWLLREPMSKVGGILVLIEVLLAACTLSAAIRLLARRPRRQQQIWAGFVGGFVCLALLFPLPIWTGAFGSDGKHGLPAAEVAVPTRWRQVAKAVNGSSTRGKLLVLPLDRYYQVTTDWGFHGADELVQQLVDRPVLQLLPDGYFAPGGDAAALMRGIESALLRGDGVRARALMRTLGVSDVLVRTDVLPSDTVPRRADVGALVSTLEQTSGVSPPQRFGVANLYALADGHDLVRAPHRIVGVTRDSVEARVNAISTLPANAAAVPPTAMPIDALSWQTSGQPTSSLQLKLRNRARYAVGLDDPLPHAWRTDINGSGQDAQLDLVDPMTLLLDGQQIRLAPPITVPIQGQRVDVIDVNSALTVRRGTRTEVDVAGPATVRAFRASAPAAHGPASARAESCGAQPAGPAALRATSIAEGVRLHAKEGIGCVTVGGPSLSPDDVYRVRMQTRTRSGAAPRVCLWARGPNLCLPIEQPPPTFGWSNHDVAVRADPDTTGLVLYLYADASGGEPATIDYRAISITPQREVGAAEVVPTARPNQQRVLRAGGHQLTVAGSRSNLRLRADTPLGDCHRTDERTAKESGLSARRIPHGVRLGASAHSACVSVPIPKAVAGDTLDVGLDLRTVSGRRARVCIWEEGPNRCAEIAPLPTSDGWTPYQTTVTLSAETSQARLYLYADGQSRPRTVTEYRNLEVRSEPPEVVHLEPLSALPRAPKVAWQAHGAESVSVETRGARSPFLLVLNESYAPGWKLDGASVQTHGPVDGYANGWYVRAPGTASLSLGYAPARIVRWGYWISAIAMLAAVGLLIHRAAERRHRTMDRRRSRGSGPRRGRSSSWRLRRLATELRSRLGIRAPRARATRQHPT